MSKKQEVFFGDFDCKAYQDQSIMSWDEEKVEEFQNQYMAEAFKRHYENCQEYRDYCDFIKVSVDEIVKDKKLDKIPLVPTSLFKGVDMRSVPAVQIDRVCLSSGTQGHVSKIYRDEISLDRLLSSIDIGIKEMYDINPNGFVIANLGPKPEEAGDVWFAYVTSAVDVLGKTTCFLKDKALRKDELYQFLKELDTDKRLIVLGPPVMMKYFIDYLAENELSLSLAKDAIVITAGGWKKFQGERIERPEFEAYIEKYLGIAKNRIYDCFNQVELNTVLFECEHKRKHIMPWLKVIARDPVTLEDVGEDQLGILTYLDASSNSYPCFIMADDLGKVSSNCPCGRKGKTIEIVRRVNKVETKGCAIKIDSRIMENK